MKKHQIKISWTVYPPNYRPGDGYFEIPFLKDAWNKACSLGEGSTVHQRKLTIHRKGFVKETWESNGVIYEVTR